MGKYIIFAIIIAFVISIVLGFYIYKLKIDNEQIAFEAEYTNTSDERIIKDAKNIIKETSSTEVKTTPNTEIIEKIYYNDCGHLIQTDETIKEKLINKNESQFQAECIGWNIQKFTSSEVVLYKEVNDFCNEHFLVKDVEGEVIIYGLDKNDKEKEVIRETGIQTKYLSDVDIENLKNGIKVYGNKELNSLIEDYE